MQKWIIIIPIIAISLISFTLISNFEINKNENIIIPQESASSSNSIPIKIGTIGTDAVKIITLFQPTADYITEKLSNKNTKYVGKVIVVKTTDEMTELLQEQKIDLYVESPLTAILISEKSDAIPILYRWKDNAFQYHSVFFVKSDSNIANLNDLSEITIAFEAPESTTGYLLPKSHLIQNGVYFDTNTENDLNYVFSGTDETTSSWIISEIADIGVMADIDYDKLPEITKSQLRVIDKTIDVPRHLVLQRSELDTDISEEIKTILLDMHKDPKGTKILKEFKNTAKYTEIKNKQELTNDIRKILGFLNN